MVKLFYCFFSKKIKLSLKIKELCKITNQGGKTARRDLCEECLVIGIHTTTIAK